MPPPPTMSPIYAVFLFKFCIKCITVTYADVFRQSLRDVGLLYGNFVCQFVCHVAYCVENILTYFIITMIDVDDRLKQLYSKIFHLSISIHNDRTTYKKYSRL